ncbi:YifB family Mg chelatase-like AAA ATPase [SAR92 clade bacterium H455]|uniref:YifB family Mg chelatase-like AAA ATPase n=1 Tax=SAR92 clade bacterium H455 TaxID=2974818 RepID=A0ABY5TTV2_9GAMM|nr:YifB family Mg chelatase-like AAA ATPase [SAR92 clade bacterium H455]
MSLAVVNTRAKLGINAPLVSVEVHLSNGLPSFHMVGLPETAVKESKDRVRSAILNSHFDFPARRITVNLAPAELPKEGSRFDLAIAVAILAASGQVPRDQLDQYEFIGELALSGDTRGVDAVLPAALGCLHQGKQLIISRHNAEEAALVDGLEILPCTHLLDISGHLLKQTELSLWDSSQVKSIKSANQNNSRESDNQSQLNQVIGQHHAKRALEISASGGHNLLFYGPPGTGKTMLASRLPGILPPLNNQQALEVASIYSVAGKGLRQPIWARPFRAPHHTASSAALVGGGSSPRPGEISLAHQGVLFLDELPEFSRSVLEVLREPMESGEINISRVAAQVCYPANFQLIAAMNPCPCGYLGSPRCRCTPDQINRYRGKISGPLLDRIDLQVQVTPIENHQLLNNQRVGNKDQAKGESDQQIQQRICVARERQLTRQGKTNSQLSSEELKTICPLSSEQRHLMDHAITRFGLSTRGFYRVLRVARSIADLAGREQVISEDYQEALSYRIASEQQSTR